MTDPDRPSPKPQPSPPSSPALPREIGGYEIQRLLGSGGMATVYAALQKQPRRTVALKIMRVAIDARAALHRFKREIEILGRLRHPFIAQVYDAGMHDDGTGAVPYFVMEYVPRARTITDFADEKNLSLRDRLKLFVKVCAAIENGHHNKIIHRDLKPGNILIDETGNPKIIDFGVARATEVDVAAQTMHTEEGRLVGTIQYMAPEQLEATRQDLDARCDVYALGAVLYKLVTGRQPHNLKGLPVFTAAQVIREDDPPRPSSIRPELKGDLETIILKALEKDRARRYRTAGSLGRDLVRFLADKPIQARKAGIVHRARLFARRHRVELTAGAVVVLVMAIAASIVVYQRTTMPAPGTPAEVETAQGPEPDGAADESAAAPAQPSPPGEVTPPPTSPEPPEAFTLSGQAGRITALTFDPTGRFLASASEDLSVMVRDVIERESILTTTDHDEPVTHIAFSADGSLLATNAADGRLVIVERAGGKIDGVLRHGRRSLHAVAVGPDAQTVALACDDLTIRTYRRDGADLHTHRGTTGAFHAVAFSADGALLAGGSEGGGVYLWEVASGDLIARFSGLRE
ncbi:MAG: serine/threonine-protein kinase [Planctomycetota bacterium]|nr:serine/threonine-protein kinase [Planctomycetota bacterium]